MSATLYQLQRDHIQALNHAYQARMAAHNLDSLAIYSGHANNHFADDHATSFQSYGHFIHWVGMADVQHSWVVIQPPSAPPSFICTRLPIFGTYRLSCLKNPGWRSSTYIYVAIKSPPPLTGHAAVIGDLKELASTTPHANVATLHPEGLVRELDELRMVKSAYEVACLREANRLAIAGHQAANAAFIGASAELDVQLAYLGASRQRESDVPYQNIIGLNEHAGVLHYQRYDLSAPKRRYSLLVDAGRRFRGYCADITRTYAGPDAPSEFGELISAMHGLKDELITQIVPGIEFLTLHEQMHRGLADILISHGLYQGSVESAVETGVTRAFCPHGLGHSLGIQVHDVAGLRQPDGSPSPAPDTHPALRLTRTLQAGMVITIEPGLYFIPMLLAPLRKKPHPIDWTLVDRLAVCGGIRIEDNILVTEGGSENLTL